MRFVFAILTVSFLLIPYFGHAETKEIITEGTYNMGDGETPSVAESRAILQAKRIALEQAGTYVESYSKVKNITLTEDEIQVLASGLMEVEILDKKRTVVGDGIHFWVKIKAKVNLDKTEELANRIKAKDKSFIEDYKKIQEAYDKSQKEIEELKKQLVKAKGEKEKKQVEAKITDEERLFQAREWYEKGYEYGAINGEYDRAIEAFTNAITIDDNYAKAYAYRGGTYAQKNQYDKAYKDINKAIELDSNLAIAYYIRGVFYHNKGQYDRAIEDYTTAIALDLQDAKVYFNRGQIYSIKGNVEQAIEDFKKVCSLGDNLGCTYWELNLKKE